MTRRTYLFGSVDDEPDEDPVVPSVDEAGKLRGDVRHGSMRAVRLGCTCGKCMARKRRANRHGHRWY